MCRSPWLMKAESCSAILHSCEGQKASSPVVEVSACDPGVATPRDPALVDGADLMPDAAYLGNLSQKVHRGQLAPMSPCRARNIFITQFQHIVL